MSNEEIQDVALENNELGADLTAQPAEKDWKAEALKFQAIARRKNEKIEKLNAQALVTPPISKTVETRSEYKPSDILKADEFKLYRAGYTESEIDLIMHNGGAKLLEDKKNPLVLGLQAAKEQRGAEDAAGRATDSSGLSDIERKYSEQDFRNMTKEDIAKLVPHVNK